MEILDKLRVALHNRNTQIDALSANLRERIKRIELLEKKIEDANDPETFCKLKNEYLGCAKSNSNPPRKDYTVALLDLQERYISLQIAKKNSADTKVKVI